MGWHADRRVVAVTFEHRAPSLSGRYFPGVAFLTAIVAASCSRGSSRKVSAPIIATLPTSKADAGPADGSLGQAAVVSSAMPDLTRDDVCTLARLVGHRRFGGRVGASLLEQPCATEFAGLSSKMATDVTLWTAHEPTRPAIRPLVRGDTCGDDQILIWCDTGVANRCTHDGLVNRHGKLLIRLNRLDRTEVDAEAEIFIPTRQPRNKKYGSYVVSPCLDLRARFSKNSGTWGREASSRLGVLAMTSEGRALAPSKRALLEEHRSSAWESELRPGSVPRDGAAAPVPRDRWAAPAPMNRIVDWFRERLLGPRAPVGRLDPGRALGIARAAAAAADSWATQLLWTDLQNRGGAKIGVVRTPWVGYRR